MPAAGPVAQRSRPGRIRSRHLAALAWPLGPKTYGGNIGIMEKKMESIGIIGIISGSGSRWV